MSDDLQIQTLARRLRNVLAGFGFVVPEVGTWTPALVGATTAGTFTYDAASTGGEYTRIGNRLLINGRVRITAQAVAPAGDLRITGLPIASASPGFGVAGGASFNIWRGLTIGAAYSQVSLRITGGVTYLNITKSGPNIGEANVQGAEFALVGGVANFDFFGEYRVG